ncbi:acyltransferase [Pedobacter sp. BMA]|uniref:acyltransferase family protein n=1 Tax=Pedobacter sp. BMA TaxID=1663685 RepID=UPI000649C12C|nr:acyltransferase [Pedobacter sp. BMA]KLT66620.1 hypothetical protein AB669_05450 [Pedobacter sp. BMA]
MNKEKDRIAILDGFRAIAILIVILFHFYSQWFNYYPYKNNFNYFSFGRYGVQFFFIISGFVIYYTLSNTQTFITFWKKRFIRLFPSMLIASVIILTILNIFDNNLLFPEGHELKNFFTSLTFINPLTFNVLLKLLGFEHFTQYLNGSYWSLWPEVQFYVFSSLIYYFNKPKFLFNFSVLSTLAVIIYISLSQINPELILHAGFRKAFEVARVIIIYHFNLASNLPYFAIGTYFCFLFKDKKLNKAISAPIISVLITMVTFELYLIENTAGRIAMALMLLLFALFIYYPKMIALLENQKIVKIGICSYFLYLIHEPIGVLMINRLGGFIHPFEVLFPILTAGFLIFISILYFSYIEKNIAKILNKLII